MYWSGKNDVQCVLITFMTSDYNFITKALVYILN